MHIIILFLKIKKMRFVSYEKTSSRVTFYTLLFLFIYNASYVLTQIKHYRHHQTGIHQL